MSLLNLVDQLNHWTSTGDGAPFFAQKEMQRVHGRLLKSALSINDKAVTHRV